jgi:hypothetical protein
VLAAPAPQPDAQANHAALLLCTQVANELLSRTQRVSVITPAHGDTSCTAVRVTELQRPECDADIERSLVESLTRMHEAWLSC